MEIVEESTANLAEYGTITSSFEVREMLDVDRLADFDPNKLPVRACRSPYTKDYDATSEGAPGAWAGVFDMKHWQLFAAVSNHQRVGGAAVAFSAPDVDMLEGRNNLALLWDIRVLPAARSRGVGSALMAAVERWSRQRGAEELRVETQNVNVPAVRFYIRHGFRVQRIVRDAYPEFPDEVQLILGKQLLRT